MPVKRKCVSGMDAILIPTRPIKIANEYASSELKQYWNLLSRPTLRVLFSPLAASPDLCAFVFYFL